MIDVRGKERKKYCIEYFFFLFFFSTLWECQILKGVYVSIWQLRCTRATEHRHCCDSLVYAGHLLCTDVLEILVRNKWLNDLYPLFILFGSYRCTSLYLDCTLYDIGDIGQGPPKTLLGIFSVKCISEVTLCYRTPAGVSAGQWWRSTLCTPLDEQYAWYTVFTTPCLLSATPSY